MNLTGGIVLFASLWFLTLFVVMPIGQQSQADAGAVVPGTHAGAPSGVNWRRKLLWTTAITSLMWAVIAVIIFGGLITRADISNLDQLIR
ncbi:DUF1467 family protein [Paracoccus aestuarii]|uniref:DUF1467 family protein n=1 Tax=Paracoccus aestuarii TaxID=453842 RepID=A0A418ZVZ3_9RHOB|nr:DUF1467 family protein [Paracoccus aestuarii]RJL03940.1 DUF1467 family protein [Paracoccus aestuarii]WCQ98691.1 DUF1467 family protein [Paracoccus aestuarii]